MSTPRAPSDYSPSLMGAFSETIEPQLPIKLDQTLTPGVYRIVNDASPKVAVDLSGYDRSSVLGEFTSCIQTQNCGAIDLTLLPAYDVHEEKNQQVGTNWELIRASK